MKRILASVLALALLAGIPAAVLALPGSADCATQTASSDAADGCCLGSTQKDCTTACHAGAGAVGGSRGALHRNPSQSPVADVPGGARSLAPPPDTAPPKFPSA